MAVIAAYAVVSAYFTPGGLVADGAGGEAGVAWGLSLLIVAAMGTAFLAFRTSRQAASRDRAIR
jgi:uncharacterized membrane protein YdjX (TVP38/TMEM64 family)